MWALPHPELGGGGGLLSLSETRDTALPLSLAAACPASAPPLALLPHLPAASPRGHTHKNNSATIMAAWASAIGLVISLMTMALCLRSARASLGLPYGYG